MEETTLTELHCTFIVQKIFMSPLAEVREYYDRRTAGCTAS